MIGECTPLLLARVRDAEGRAHQRSFRRVSFDKSHLVDQVIFLRRPTLAQYEEVLAVALPSARLYGLHGPSLLEIKDREPPLSSSELTAHLEEWAPEAGVKVGRHFVTKGDIYVSVVPALPLSAFHVVFRAPADSDILAEEELLHWKASRTYPGGPWEHLKACLDLALAAFRKKLEAA